MRRPKRRWAHGAGRNIILTDAQWAASDAGWRAAAVFDGLRAPVMETARRDPLSRRLYLDITETWREAVRTAPEGIGDVLWATPDGAPPPGVAREA